jgi:hypothetical protein
MMTQVVTGQLQYLVAMVRRLYLVAVQAFALRMS